MSVMWKDLIDEKPDDYQNCITKTHKGYISGIYDPKENCFFGIYPQSTGGYWKEIQWSATHWAPVEEME